MIRYHNRVIEVLFPILLSGLSGCRASGLAYVEKAPFVESPDTRPGPDGRNGYFEFQSYAKSLPPQELRKLLQHSSWVVRSYAVGYVVEHEPSLIPALEPLLFDKTPIVLAGYHNSIHTSLARYTMGTLCEHRDQAAIPALLLKAGADYRLDAIPVENNFGPVATLQTSVQLESLACIAELRRTEVTRLARFYLDHYADRPRQSLPVVAFGLADDDRGYAALALFAMDPNPLVREVTARVLGELGDLRGLPILERMADEPNIQVRMKVAAALGRHAARIPDVIKKLLADFHCKTEMENSLARAADPAALALLKDQLLPLRERTLGSERSYDSDLMRIIVKTTSPAVTDLMRQLLTSLSGGEVRREALNYLFRVKDSASSPAIRRLLDSTDGQDRIAAAQAAGELGDRDAIPALEALLKRGGPEDRVAAEGALVKLGSKVQRASSR